jgi:hydroxyquinol 1,2-dioxygenase
VSLLVDFINYGDTANVTESTVQGPFYVEGAPEMPMGADIAKSGTLGERAFPSGAIKGDDGCPITGAHIDVWEGSGEGLYDVQTDGGTNLRARFRTGADGKYSFYCVRPVSYPVPNDGPVGKMLRATGRHPMRPGHLHFMINAPGYATLADAYFLPRRPLHGFGRGVRRQGIADRGFREERERRV